MHSAVAVGLVIINAFDMFEPMRSFWEWGILNDLPQGWAILIGLALGLCAIAWQTSRGFGSLIKSQQNQAELDRQARQQLLQLERRAETDARAADGKALAAALIGELTVCHRMQSLRATNLGVMQAVSKKIGGDGASAAEPFTSPAISTPVYQSIIPQLGLLGASLVADVVAVYSRLNMEAHGDKPPRAELLTTVVEDLRDITHVITRLQAFQEGSRDPGPVEFLVKQPEGTGNSADVGSEKTVLVTRQDTLTE
jgi:hypothetical protein